VAHQAVGGAERVAIWVEKVRVQGQGLPLLLSYRLLLLVDFAGERRCLSGDYFVAGSYHLLCPISSGLILRVQRLVEQILRHLIISFFPRLLIIGARHAHHIVALGRRGVLLARVSVAVDFCSVRLLYQFGGDLLCFS